MVPHDDEDAVFYSVEDPSKIPEAMVPSLQTLIQVLCKTDAQKTQAQAYLDARDMTLNQWLNTLSDDEEEDDEDFDEEELRSLGYDV